MTVRAALIRCSIIIEMRSQPANALWPSNSLVGVPDHDRAYTIAKYEALPRARHLCHKKLEARCWYWIGRCELGRREWQAAVDAFERAIELGVVKCRLRPIEEGKDVREWLELAEKHLASSKKREHVHTGFNPFDSFMNTFEDFMEPSDRVEFTREEMAYINEPARKVPVPLGREIAYSPINGRSLYSSRIISPASVKVARTGLTVDDIQDSPRGYEGLMSAISELLPEEPTSENPRSAISEPEEAPQPSMQRTVFGDRPFTGPLPLRRSTTAPYPRESNHTVTHRRTKVCLSIDTSRSLLAELQITTPRRTPSTCAARRVASGKPVAIIDASPVPSPDRPITSAGL
jgi:hypothetical protein